MELDAVAQLAPALRNVTVRWVILDPMHLSAPAFEEAISIIAAAGVKVAIYTSLSGLNVARLLACQQRLLPELQEVSDSNFVAIDRNPSGIDTLVMGTIKARISGR